MADGASERRVRIIQGKFEISDDPAVIFTTILGSCIAACLRDPEARVGGMNHFLLPGEKNVAASQAVERYGAHLMELLVNGLLKKGAKRQRLEAKIFGGARMMKGLSDIGSLNAIFASKFLATEGIAIVGQNVGDTRCRRVEYWPVTGVARQMFVQNPDDLPTTNVESVRRHLLGNVEFF